MGSGGQGNDVMTNISNSNRGSTFGGKNINASASYLSSQVASRDGSIKQLGSITPIEFPTIEEKQELNNHNESTIREEEFKTLLY